MLLQLYPRVPHRAQFIMVENNIKLEVLDWGGTGRPLVLLAGLETRLMYSTSSLPSCLRRTTFMASQGAASARPALRRLPVPRRIRPIVSVTTFSPSSMHSS